MSTETNELSHNKRHHEQDKKDAAPSKKQKNPTPIMSLVCATDSDELSDPADVSKYEVFNWAAKIQGLSTKVSIVHSYQYYLPYQYTVELVVPKNKIPFVHALLRSAAKQDGTGVQLYSAYIVMGRANNCHHQEWRKNELVQTLIEMADGDSIETILSWMYGPETKEVKEEKSLLWPDLVLWKSMLEKESLRNKKPKAKNADDNELESCYGKEQMNLVASCIFGVPFFGQCLVFPLHCSRSENYIESKSRCPEIKYALGTNDPVMLEVQDEKRWLEFYQTLCKPGSADLVVINDEKQIVKKCLAICPDGQVIDEQVSVQGNAFSKFLQKYINNRFELMAPQELSSESLLTIYKLLKQHHYPSWPASVTTASIRDVLLNHFFLFVDEEMLCGSLAFNRHFLDRKIYGTLCVAPKKFYS